MERAHTDNRCFDSRPAHPQGRGAQQKKERSFAVLHLLRLALIGVCALLAVPAHADITIGHVLPLTGTGAETARELSLGARVYVDQVNAAGGIAGHKVVYLVRDDAGTPEQSLVRAGELIEQDQAFGLLEGATPANVEALVSSGALRQHGVPMLGVKGGIGSPAGLAGARQAGLVEVVQAQDIATVLRDEFTEALAKYAPAGAAYSDAALQGYVSAKVLVGAIRMLPRNPTHDDFYAVVQNMIPDLARRLALSRVIPQ